MKVDQSIIQLLHNWSKNIILFFCIIVFPDFPLANTVSCPSNVDYVLIEVGNYKPFPDLITPDVTGETDDDLQQWNYLSRRPADVPIVVHCYANEQDEKSVDVVIPLFVTTCSLFKKHFECE